LIHRAEPVRTDNNRRCAQGHNQIARIETPAKWTQQTARAFNQHNVKTFLHRADVRDHISQRDTFFLAARSEQWRDGRAEMPRVDFIE